MGHPFALLGAVGSAGQDNSVVNPKVGSTVNMHATATNAEEACRQEKSLAWSLLV